MSNEERRHTRHRGPGGGHGPHGMMPGEKAKDFKGTFRKLLGYMGRYRIALVFVAVFAAGGTVFGIVGPKILGKATTEIFNGLMGKLSGSGGIDFTRIGKILLFLLGLYLLSTLLNFIQGLIMTGIVQKICYRFREDISEKIHRMPMKYFESRTVGEVLSRITNDVDTLGQGLNQSVTQLISAVTTIIGVLIMMLSISPLMTLIAFVILPVSGILVSVVVKHSQKFFVNQQKYLGRVNGQVEEVYGGQNVVKAFNKEADMLAEFDETNGKLFQSAWKSQFLSGMMQPIMMFVSNLGYVAVAVVGGVLTVRGTIEVGDIQSFIQYVRSFTQPIMQVAQVSNMLQSTAAAAERVFEFLDEEEEDILAKNPVHLEKMEGRVSFEHVQFGYDPSKIVIHDFNCQVEPGQMVAIVGPTGAGKTTIVNLLMRFYEINSGEIKIDGVPISSMKREEVHSKFCMVLQDTWLFEGTVKENLIYCSENQSEEKMRNACKAVGLDHFIRTLPHGYDTILNDQVNLSQGQKQQLTIARAMIADKPILILDEATSSIDTRTEQKIQNAMDELMKGRTSFVIAHRLSTIKNADLILVLKDGDVIESGNHDELMKQNGFYAELYNSQFEQAS